MAVRGGAAGAGGVVDSGEERVQGDPRGPGGPPPICWGDGWDREDGAMSGALGTCSPFAGAMVGAGRTGR
jgi:hypothetical protein